MTHVKMPNTPREVGQLSTLSFATTHGVLDTKKAPAMAEAHFVYKLFLAAYFATIFLTIEAPLRRMM